MITFKELKITPDGHKLIIDVFVKDLPYYTDVFIDSIIIDTQATFLESGPSSKAIYNYKVEGDKKALRLELDKLDLSTSLNDNLFFIYVKTKGIPADYTPCGMDKRTSLRALFNFYPAFQHAFGYIKELSNSCCDIPKTFINFILQYKAFELSIRVGHYTEAINYWKKFFSSIKGSTINSNCGCHG